MYFQIYDNLKRGKLFFASLFKSNDLFSRQQNIFEKAKAGKKNYTATPRRENSMYDGNFEKAPTEYINSAQIGFQHQKNITSEEVNKQK